MSWYRKHRPRQIKDLHLENVRQTFLQMMKSGRIPQVLLFAGPKGTGKTSASRIIGALLNDQVNQELVDYVYFKPSGVKLAKPKQAAFQEPDPGSEFAEKVYQGQSFVVQEMDAASHRGIDDVRALKDRVMLPPQQGKMAVYILDEAHMLTTEAFNALLKLLEEPPPHVVFILATTELHKIPATVASRCTLVEFHKASLSELTESLNKVLAAEKIKSEPEAIKLIAQRADGSFRDAVKLLEMVCQTGELKLTQVEELLGGSLQQDIEQLVKAVLAKDALGLVDQIQSLRARNIDPIFFQKLLFNFLHTSLMQTLGVEEGKPAFNQAVARFLLNELISVDWQSPSPIPLLPLELKLLEIIERAKKKQPGGGPGLGQASGAGDKAKPAGKPAKKPTATRASQAVLPPLPDPAVLRNSNYSGSSQQLIEQWDDFIKVVAHRNNTLAALLRSSKPIVGVDSQAKIGVFYRFHQEQLQQAKFRQIFDQCTEELVGGPVSLDFLLQETPREADLVETRPSPNLTKMVEAALLEPVL